MAENWSDDELAAAVGAYIEMAGLEAARKSYFKRDIYRDLAERFGRTEKAFEYRMQNISAVLDELGKSWIPGLKPAGNVGANVKHRIVALVERWEKDNWISTEKEASYKRKLPAMRDWLIEVARHRGQVTYGQVMKAFGIDRFSLRYVMEFLGHQANNLDEPIITALIVGTKTRRCSSGLAKEFSVHDDDAERQRLYDFWSNHEGPVQAETALTDLEVKAARFVSVEARPEQAAFRRQVYLACQGKCVISGCNVLSALDAAHKHGRDWHLGHNRAEDGHLLRKDLHALYDNKLLWITDEGKVELASSVMEHYKSFLGIRIMDRKHIED
jgi:hypothetical protein